MVIGRSSARRSVPQSVRLSLHLSINPPIHSSIYPSVHPPAHPLILPFINLSIHQLIKHPTEKKKLKTKPTNHQSANIPTYQPINQYTDQSII